MKMTELKQYLDDLYYRDFILYQSAMQLLTYGITITNEDLDRIQEDAAKHGFKWIQKSNGDWTVEKLLPQGNNIEKSQDCEHIWKKYDGFSDSYEYCEKCDKKR